MLDNLGSSLRKTLLKIRGAPIVDEKLINELVEDLENALLSADVNLDQTVRKKQDPLRLNPNETSIILFIGIQGSGKTTSIGKIANYFQKRGFKIGVIGGDTFRPGALAQLQQLLAPINVDVFGDEKEKKAINVIKKGLKYFNEKKSNNLILVDTTGRHKEEKALLKEMQSIAKVIKPTEITLVIDATIGQQAQTQAD
ncbi:MAG: signal recognition particle receptor subunit alpha, partial [Candidatus Hodarchaeales archaeon]